MDTGDHSTHTTTGIWGKVSNQVPGTGSAHRMLGTAVKMTELSPWSLGALEDLTICWGAPWDRGSPDPCTPRPEAEWG
jgi:hypothetical protein